MTVNLDIDNNLFHREKTIKLNAELLPDNLRCIIVGPRNYGKAYLLFNIIFESLMDKSYISL